MGVIYVRPNLINGKKYVGQATDLKKRQNDWKCLTQPYAGAAINNARAKYSIDNFGFEILKECKDEELDYWEKYYIKELNTKAPYGYNLTDGGDGLKGYSPSEETRKKLSEYHKCKHLSEETKRKISEGKKGRHLSEEWKRKIGEGNKGKKPWCKGKHHSEETKKKMSDAQKGIPNIKLSKPVLQIDMITNEIIAEFPSTREVERQLGFYNTYISACCNGKRKSAYGYKWQYK